MNLYAIKLPDGSIAMTGPYVLATENQAQADRMAHARDGDVLTFTQDGKPTLETNTAAPGMGDACEWIEVLKRLQEALPGVGLNGWTSGVAALDWAIPILTRAAQPAPTMWNALNGNDPLPTPAQPAPVVVVVVADHECKCGWFIKDPNCRVCKPGTGKS